MSIQDFKDKIKFDARNHPDKDYCRVHRASIHLTVTVESSGKLRSEAEEKALQDHIKEALTHRLLVMLYESRNRELIELLMDYEKAGPFSADRHELFGKILNAARYQPPTT